MTTICAGFEEVPCPQSGHGSKGDDDRSPDVAGAHQEEHGDELGGPQQIPGSHARSLERLLLGERKRAL